jgi:hypothetical protein
MSNEYRWFVGVDWASVAHQVGVIDAKGQITAERVLAHGGEGPALLCDWLVEQSGCAPEAIAVAIETPHGPVVEALLERGFGVHAINPKQLDRFRDRHTVAGAKDDRRDARVLADALRTDPHCFRRLSVVDPRLIELRELSRIVEELQQERTRLTNRIRQQLWRYYPQVLELGMISWPTGCSICGISPRRRQPRLAFAQLRCRVSSQSIAFDASRPVRSLLFFTSQRSQLRRELPRRLSPTSGCWQPVSGW